ncbi:16737_t:CDS:2 [Funneliformis mosseae]|uniref:16737_t:CDS:1 n=1 Tax=Funneliformis mosseae TaxID=27381 RepID=A0A9N9G775_FUNMO|nr:16737_t:CDS:2 [Funneliformis mosseae]
MAFHNVDLEEESDPLLNNDSSFITLISDVSIEIKIDYDDLILDEPFDQYKDINSENNSKKFEKQYKRIHIATPINPFNDNEEQKFLFNISNREEVEIDTSIFVEENNDIYEIFNVEHWNKNTWQDRTSTKDQDLLTGSITSDSLRGSRTLDRIDKYHFLQRITTLSAASNIFQRSRPLDRIDKSGLFSNKYQYLLQWDRISVVYLRIFLPRYEKIFSSPNTTP